MAETPPAATPTTTPTPTPVRTPPADKRPVLPLVIGAAVMLLLLGLQNWVLQAQTARVRELGFRHSVDALGAAVVPLMLQGDTGKLRQTATDIAKAGGYRAVIFADRNKTVLASTDTRAMDIGNVQTDPTPLEARVSAFNGGLRAVRAVTVGGDNVLGYIVVESADQ
jgi:hypothetical protein